LKPADNSGSPSNACRPGRMGSGSLITDDEVILNVAPAVAIALARVPVER
jgi:hypothetical protein